MDGEKCSHLMVRRAGQHADVLKHMSVIVGPHFMN